MPSVLIQNGTIVNADSTVKADLLIDGETIKEIRAGIPASAAQTVVDATGLLLLPGGIDAHTHLDMPFGGSKSADDFETGTRAAAIGGTTTIVDFAIQARGTRMRTALDTWWKKAEGKACIDYGLHMIVTDLPDAGLEDMDDMVREGVASFKLFMAYPNVLMVDDATIFKALRQTAKNGALVCMHAENGSVIDVIVQQALAEGKTAPIYHALTRPTRAEAEAVHRAIAMAEMAGVPIYIVHLSSEDALNQVREARDRGLPAFAETCPQYLLLSIEDNMEDKGWEGAKYVFTPRCASAATSRSCGTVCAPTISKSSRPIIARSVLKIRRRWGKMISPRFPTEDRASRTGCNSSTITAWARAISLLTASSKLSLQRRRASSACIRGKACWRQAATLTLSSGILWQSTRSPLPRITCGWTTRCSKASACAGMRGTCMRAGSRLCRRASLSARRGGGIICGARRGAERGSERGREQGSGNKGTASVAFAQRERVEAGGG